MKLARPIYFLALVALVSAGAGCGWKPKIKVPFIGGSPAMADPDVAFDVRKPLTNGHTLKLSVYRNLISRSRVYSGTVTVDSKGDIHFKGAGNVHVGGISALAAVKAVEAAFSREYGNSTVTVQLHSVEGVPVVTVTGAVRSPAVLQWFDGMTADAALSYVGGRTSHAEARAVHVTRDGSRRFYSESGGVSLKAGDWVAFSRDF